MGTGHFTKASIDRAFAQMINERGVHNKVEKSSEAVRQYRTQLKNGIPISMNLKLDLLQRTGWKSKDFDYTASDLLSLVKFALSTSDSAENFGPAYIIEKWEDERK